MTSEITAMDVRIGDRIEFNRTVWTVNFVTLVRGTFIDITVKEIGLQARSAPEHILHVHKNSLIKKVS